MGTVSNKFNSPGDPSLVPGENVAVVDVLLMCFQLDLLTPVKEEKPVKLEGQEEVSEECAT